MCFSTEYAKGQQISKLVDESFVPNDQCTEDELLQFAERFQEWSMINKKIHDSEDPESLDLQDIINQARLFGLTQSEKTAILKVRIDSNCTLYASVVILVLVLRYCLGLGQECPRPMTKAYNLPARIITESPKPIKNHT